MRNRIEIRKKWGVLRFFYILLTKPDDKHRLLPIVENAKGILQKFAQFLYMQDRQEYACFRKLLYNGAPYPHSMFTKELSNWEAKGVKIHKDAVKCGSIGQIYEGTYFGKDIILKCVLPDIKTRVEKDIKFMEKMASFFFRFFRLPHQRVLVSYLSLFRSVVLSEADYLQEIANIKKFRLKCRNDKVYIPEVIDGLCTDTVIAQEKCQGVPIEEFLSGAPLWQRIEVIRVLFDFYFSSFLEYGLLHGDPHFGNFFVQVGQENGIQSIVLEVIDFGCIESFTADYVKSVQNLIRCLREERINEAFDFTRELGFDADELSAYRQIIVPLMYAVLEPFLTEGQFNFGEWRLNYTINTIMSSIRVQGPLTLPPKLLLLFRVFSGCLSYLSFLDEGLWDMYQYFSENPPHGRY